MKIRELNGEERAGEFEGGIEVIFDDGIKIWTSPLILKEAVHRYLATCKPLGANKSAIAVVNGV